MIFKGGLLKRAKGKVFINCATVSPDDSRLGGRKSRKQRREFAGSVHGVEHHAGARRFALFDVRRQRRSVQSVKPILEKLSTSLRYIGTAGKAAQVKALVNMVMNINTAGLAEGLGLGWRARTRSRDGARSVFANRREFPRAGHRRRRHAKPRSFLFLFRITRGERFRHRLETRQRAKAQSASGDRDQETIRPDDQRRFGRIG